MKKYTFEELIKNYDEDFYKKNNYYLSQTEPETFALELMKQVRLSTLEECANKADTDFNIIKVNDNSLENNIEVYVLKHSILDLDKNSIEVN